MAVRRYREIACYKDVIKRFKGDEGFVNLMAWYVQELPTWIKDEEDELLRLYNYKEQMEEHLALIPDDPSKLLEMFRVDSKEAQEIISILHKRDYYKHEIDILEDTFELVENRVASLERNYNNLLLYRGRYHELLSL